MSALPSSPASAYAFGAVPVTTVLRFNVALDLQPFERINVCGYRGLIVTQLADLCGVSEVRAAALGLTPHLLRELQFVTREGAAAQSAINTDLQAVSSL